MKKLCGYDLNGWRDTAARSWATESDGEETEVGCSIVSGGLLGVVVQTGDSSHPVLVGGAQAMIAPHGLGNGWGEVGRSERRIAIRHLLAGSDTTIEQMTSALSGLSVGAGYGVAAIADFPEADEVFQERMLSSLRKVKASTPLLVWRSVLAALYEIGQSTITRDQTVGVVSQTEEGLVVQRLRVRAVANRGEEILAPERKTGGQHIASNWGYKGLHERAFRNVLAAATTDRTDHLGNARSIGRLALGDDPSTEVIRLPNGDWEVISARPLEIGDLAVPASLTAALEDCDVILLETLLRGELGKALLQQVNDAVAANVIALPPTAVAEGALIAARRMSVGEPVYFDFLPQISTIVQRADGALSYDLIDPEATLPAGDIYRSPEPAKFAIQAGQEKFSVFLKKETAAKPRRAEVNIGMKLPNAVPVDLSVEQSPAAGRAKILLHSPSLGHRFQVDWDGAEEIESTWEEVIESLQTGKPTIPGRLVLQCGIAAWNDTNRGDGLLKLVLRYDNSPSVDWGVLASKLSARPDGQYPISSDGDLPEDLPPECISALQRLTARAVAHVAKRLNGEISESNNDSLRFLSWQFRRCPPEVTAWLVDALDQENRGYRLFKHGASWKLAYQGLGRTVGSRSVEHQVMHKILGKTVDTWRWSNETAAMAFMLSRSETAPLLLTRKDVDRIGKRVLREFDDNLATAYTKFQYAPLLLVGLLRWRLVEPYSLVVGRDPLADKLARCVERTLEDLEHRNRVRPSAKYSKLLEQSLEELRGEGSNPDLLLDIFGGADAAEVD